MYKISDFSRISQTSIQTLRYYDSIGILKPSEINEDNNYRYYKYDQLINLKIIKKLKLMGLRLEDIKVLLNGYNLDILDTKKEELRRNIKLEEQSIKDIRIITEQIKNKKINVQNALSNLINKDERNNNNMKENYEKAKEKLINGYKLFQEGNREECLVQIEELRAEIFSAVDAIDPFWHNIAGDLFAGITIEVYKSAKIEEINFLTIFQFKVNGEEQLSKLKEYTSKLDQDSYAYINLVSIANSPMETKESIISVFKQKLKQYTMFDTTK